MRTSKKARERSRAAPTRRSSSVERGATTKRFYHFSFFRSLTRSPLLLHDLRDGDAFAEVAGGLAKHGYGYGGLLLNAPDSTDGGEWPSLGEDDVVAVTTRPPISDDTFDRRIIRNTGTAQEEELLATAERHFSCCSRKTMRLSKRAARQLGQFRDRTEVEFRVYGTALCTRRGDPYAHQAARRGRTKVAGDRTLAYLVSAPVRPRGPLLLNAFGMDGPLTLVWCHLLRTRFPQFLAGPRFVVAEIEVGAIPACPKTLAFAEQWPVHILADVPSI